jgi:GDP-L-fucose synthase
MDKDSRIFVAGHAGMVGSAIVRRLGAKGYGNILTRTRAETDLSDQAQVRALFAAEKVDVVFLAAARVGGILANATYPGTHIYENLILECNVINAAKDAGVKELVFLGSSCIYPRDCPQPIKEEYLLTGPLEETNRAYAIAKIAGVALCDSFNREFGTRYVSAMPTNLYGPGENYDLASSHVFAALIRKAHEAKVSGANELVVWGSGRPMREFLHTDDAADACILLLESGIQGGLFNVGAGQDIAITELARLIADVVGFDGQIALDPRKPDGTPRKLLDSSKLRALGWQPRIALKAGIAASYRDYLEQARAR